jgi:hypothetical protein
MNTEKLFLAIGNISDKYIEAAAPKNRRKKNKAFRLFAPLAATAAVLCFVIFGNMLLNLPSGNSFTVQAYAMGSLGQGQSNFTNPYDGFGGYYDGEFLYLSIGLRYEGNNIKNVEISVDEGFFATQYIGVIEDGVPRTHMGEEGLLVMYGTDFNMVGNTITFGSTFGDDTLLFWVSENADINYYIPEEIELHAVAIFDDGSRQEESITVIFTGNGGGVGLTVIADGALGEELTELDRQSNLLRNTPLSEFELIPESVKVFTDIYEFAVGEFGNTMMFHAEWTQFTEFDEDGIHRGGYMSDDSREFYYMLVIERGNDGTLTGMVYKIKI